MKMAAVDDVVAAVAPTTVDAAAVAVDAPSVAADAVAAAATTAAAAPAATDIADIAAATTTTTTSDVFVPEVITPKVLEPVAKVVIDKYERISGSCRSYGGLECGGSGGGTRKLRIGSRCSRRSHLVLLQGTLSGKCQSPATGQFGGSRTGGGERSHGN